MIAFAELTTKLAAGVVPKSTAVAPVNLDPEMLTLVPPTDGPLGGLSEVTVGPVEGPTTRVVLATRGDPGAGLVPFPSKGVTFVSDTVNVWLPSDNGLGSVKEPDNACGVRVVPL